MHPQDEAPHTHNGLQACHDLVPPDALEPVLRQLVDTFVHDRAQPEVMTLGLRTVRELCSRCPLIMTPALLQACLAALPARLLGTPSAAPPHLNHTAALGMQGTACLLLHLHEQALSGSSARK